MDAPHVLLIDNYDSYTYNLFQLVGQITGRPPVVVRNDSLPALDSVRRTYTHIIISPGPGHPADPLRAGYANALLTTVSLPVLGVCLGHQMLAIAFGGEVRPVVPRHGLTSVVRHDGRGVFERVPQGFRAVRYHSLAVTSVPSPLEAIAHADDGVVMGMRHRRLPLHGVQFHPESVYTEHGGRIMENFLGQRAKGERIAVARPPNRAPAATILVREVPWRDPEDVFVAHYARQPRLAWLDTAVHDRRTPRMSYLGIPEGPRAHGLSYRLGDGTVQVECHDDITSERADLFDFLAGRLGRLSVAAADAPYPFRGGYIGYLGYGMGRQCGAGGREATTPDAAFLYVERFLAFDHDRRRLYLNALATREDRSDAHDWLDRMEQSLARVQAAERPARTGWLSEVTAPGRGWYDEAFRRVQRYLRLGESYEVNLTYRMTFTCTADTAELYRHLRRTNPAPYSAFLRITEVTVLSSSPECFLCIDADGTVEARPIKGTARRQPDPAADEQARAMLTSDDKTFAENLMVTDLLRNDLGQVCQVGTVRVPELMNVETYATVHQLVTTVKGVLASNVDAVRCLRAVFPPGSMTGAPKMRTTEIIEEVEEDARGVYSGALGYLSLSGEADFGVVIRTIVAQDRNMSIGVGGGIVALSNPDDEYAESMLKAEALLRAVRLACADEDLPRPGGR